MLPPAVVPICVFICLGLRAYLSCYAARLFYSSVLVHVVVCLLFSKKFLPDHHFTLVLVVLVLYIRSIMYIN